MTAAAATRATSAATADVCLVTDSYPYLDREPVARAIADLVAELDTRTFAVAFVSARGDLPLECRFPLPPHVVDLVEVARGARRASPGPAGPPPRPVRFDAARVRSLLLRLAEQGDFEALPPIVAGVADLDAGAGVLDLAAGIARRLAPDRPLVGSLAAAREGRLPAALELLQLGVRRLPRARLYHAFGDDIALLLAFAASLRTGAPLVVSDPGRGGADGASTLAVIRPAAFARAACVIAPLDRTRRRLEAELAAATGGLRGRFVTVPFGVEVAPRSTPSKAKPSATIALLAATGVRPAEDVKTFIRAGKLLVEGLDLVDLHVVGSTDVDEAYHRDCLALAGAIGVERLIRFPGAAMGLADYLPYLDCAAIAGVSDAYPRLAIETMAAGVPVVAGDSGAVPEAIEGSTERPDDRALGPSGLLFPPADPEALAAAIARAVTDASQGRRLAEAGRVRGARTYSRAGAVAAYEDVYEEALA